MRLSRIFVGQALDLGAQIHLDSDACHYLKNVLRLKSDATIVLFNGEDHYDYEGLISYEGKQAMATIQNRLAGNTESTLSTEIIQGLSRSDHMDWMIQKCTELGVNRISVFNADHTQITLKPAQLKKRMLHWRKIAIKACEQCGRQVPPQISFQQNLASAIEESAPGGLKILLDIEGDRLQSGSVSNKPVEQIAITLGPEGGLSETEIKSAKKTGFVAASIGPRVLRTETAAATALAIIQFTFGDF
jgi:16S rRNA (uracil1498-N3)-methyltransferase